MKSIIVGGNFGENPKASSIIQKLSDELDYKILKVYNGGTLDTFKNIDLKTYDLVLWMPNISNEIKKIYPKKDKGSNLICSKVIREGTDEKEAITRIFRMHGNAVIAIYSDKKPFRFKLIDALGNLWIDTTDIKELSNSIKEFYDFSSSSIRYQSEQITDMKLDFLNEYSYFIELNKLAANNAEHMGGRYFGNCSTRCEKLFPSARVFNYEVLVSRRNIDKSRLTQDDLVLCKLENNIIKYNGEHKPSVDTPIQLKIYNNFPEINYMIHGHYYIEDAPFTEHYFPCGDMREFNEIKKILEKGEKNGKINLKNHGFLLYSSNISEMEKLIKFSIFQKRSLTEKI